MITLCHTILDKIQLDKWSAQHSDILPDNTQHSSERDIHAKGRIRTRNASKREAADPCLRMQGQWDWLSYCSICIWNLDPLHNRSKVWRYLITQQWEAGSQSKELTAECRQWHNDQFCHHPTGLLEPHYKYYWSFLWHSRSAQISSTW